jgi:hypothetical protein
MIRPVSRLYCRARRATGARNVLSGTCQGFAALRLRLRLRLRVCASGPGAPLSFFEASLEACLRLEAFASGSSRRTEPTLHVPVRTNGSGKGGVGLVTRFSYRKVSYKNAPGRESPLCPEHSLYERTHRRANTKAKQPAATARWLHYAFCAGAPHLPFALNWCNDGALVRPSGGCGLS